VGWVFLYTTEEGMVVVRKRRSEISGKKKEK